MRLKEIAETFKRDLQDPEFIEGYLQEALTDGIPSFLVALSDVAKANQGMGQLSIDSNLSRESLYKTLSENGNPHLTTIDRVLNSLGMQLAVIRR
jgi:probable addiction module antidote protein